MCYGSLIDENHILTTTECQENLRKLEREQENPNTGGLIFENEESRPLSAQFLNDERQYDLFFPDQMGLEDTGLVMYKLAQPIDFSRNDDIRPICLFKDVCDSKRNSCFTFETRSQCESFIGNDNDKTGFPLTILDSEENRFVLVGFVKDQLSHNEMCIQQNGLWRLNGQKYLDISTILGKSDDSAKIDDEGPDVDVRDGIEPDAQTLVKGDSQETEGFIFIDHENDDKNENEIDCSAFTLRQCEGEIICTDLPRSGKRLTESEIYDCQDNICDTQRCEVKECEGETVLSSISLKESIATCQGIKSKFIVTTSTTASFSVSTAKVSTSVKTDEDKTEKVDIQFPQDNVQTTEAPKTKKPLIREKTVEVEITTMFDCDAEAMEMYNLTEKDFCQTIPNGVCFDDKGNCTCDNGFSLFQDEDEIECVAGKSFIF